VAVGLLALVNWWRKSSKRRTLLAIPIMPIASLRARQVSITGSVRSRNMELRSPLSDLHCVYYSFEVLRLVRTGKDSSSWEAAISDSDCIDFQLEDDTGSILISSIRDAELHLKDDRYVRTRRGEDPPEDIQKVLFNRYGDSLGWMESTGGFKISEKVIPLGDSLCVFGTAQCAEDNTLSVSGGENFLVSDRDRSWVLWHFNKAALISLLVGVAANAIGVKILIWGW
jgi:hypothetical protein